MEEQIKPAEQKQSRPSWDEYFMNLAHLAATRSTCNRGVPVKYAKDRKGVGAVIAGDKVTLATGYNGSARGLDHCDEVGHEIVEGHCIRTVHAEANAVASAAKRGVAIDGATVYSTASPCYDCFKLLINCGVKRVVCGSFYGSRYGASDKVVALAAQAGIQLEFMKSYADNDHSLDPDTMRLDTKSSDRKLKIKKLRPDATIPNFAREGDAGLDLYTVDNLNIDPGERVKVATGIAMEIPPGYVGLIWDRTGVSFKRGLKIIGGVVDSSYRGEIFPLMANISDEQVEISAGEKIAQMVIQPFSQPEIELTNEISQTERGEQMFGSSDLKPISQDDIKKVIKINNPEEDNGSQKGRW